MLRANFEALVIFNPQFNKQPPSEFLKPISVVRMDRVAFVASCNNQLVRVVMAVANWLAVQRVFPWLIHAHTSIQIES
mgnify:CR=1 FL=1